MTISNPLNEITVGGDGINTSFDFPFVADTASNLVITHTSSASVSTQLSSSQYSVTLNPIAANQLWSVGGSVTYPSSGSAMPLGDSLTIARILPYTQLTSVRNQGNFYSQVTEQALDILQMQIQQIAGDVTAISAGSAASLNPPYVFVCGPVGGTANALTVSNTNPPNFSLNDGTFITFTPTTFNAAGATTLNVLGTGNINLYRLSPNGPTPVTQGDIIPTPLLAQYISSIPGWFVVNDIYSSSATTVGSATSLSIGTTFIPYITTTAVTFTVAPTTTLPIFWYNEINANGGAATIQPNATDRIVANGSTMSAGVSLTIPAQQSAKLFTDGNGHLYLNYLLPSAASNVGTFTNPNSVTVNANGLVTAISSGASIAANYKSGNFNYNTSTASGVQVVSGITTGAGVSFTPKQIDWSAAYISAGNAASWCMGTDDGYSPVCFTSQTSAVNLQVGNGSIYIVHSGGNAVAGQISAFSNGNFTVAWTKTGSPTGLLRINYSLRG